MKRRLLSLLLLFALMFNMIGCAQGDVKETPSAKESEKTAKSEDLKLAIGIAPGPVTYPLAHMADQNSGIELKLWQGPEQLSSMITTKEVQLCSTPINNALRSYNKGLDVKLLMVTVWGMLYVMSTEENVDNLQDLKGEEVAISGQGGIHDLIFRHLLIENNINPETDLKITYMDMPEASSRLATGQLKYAVLNEPHSSIVTMNAKKAGNKLNRVLDLTEEWSKLPGQEKVRLPMAGIIVINDNKTTSKQYASFEKQYTESADWVNNHPEEAGPIVEKYVPWMKAPAVSQSVKFSRLQPQKAVDCQKEIETFFKELSRTTDPKAFGGKIPDAGFYYQAE
jgi:NitT/TauT family transport system substrate-binding protein